MLTACGGNGSRSADSADSVADTLAPVYVIERHPDTVFASVDRVTFRVDTFMHGADGRIDNLASLYADAPGVFTFRGNPHRDASFYGTLAKHPDSISVDWKYITHEDYRQTSHGRWGGGSGWTGQPLLVQWPDSMIRAFRKSRTDSLTAGFGRREVIVGSLCGEVCFINFDTGKESRLPLPVGNPVKGTVSLDPTLNGNLYVGQGVPARRPFGAIVADLYTHRISDFHGEDPMAYRRWGAYDSSPLRVGRFLIRPGENGILYKYLVTGRDIRLHSTLRYTVNGATGGIENSIAVDSNYGYFGDNHGNVLCVNLDNMRPVWFYGLGDDIDATPVLQREDGRLALYVSCEVDRRGSGDALFAKLDALTGTELWRTGIPARRVEVDGKHFDGGYYASPLPGAGDCRDLIFSNCVENTDSVRRNGSFVAFDRKSGKIAYKTPLRYYAWSSPVGFMTPDSAMYVVTADCSGSIYIIEGRTGRIVRRRAVGGNFESSPVVAGNSLVVGSRGNSIYKVSIH